MKFYVNKFLEETSKVDVTTRDDLPFFSYRPGAKQLKIQLVSSGPYDKDEIKEMIDSGRPLKLVFAD